MVVATSQTASNNGGLVVATQTSSQQDAAVPAQKAILVAQHTERILDKADAAEQERVLRLTLFNSGQGVTTIWDALNKPSHLFRQRCEVAVSVLEKLSGNMEQLGVAHYMACAAIKQLKLWRGYADPKVRSMADLIRRLGDPMQVAVLANMGYQAKDRRSRLIACIASAKTWDEDWFEKVPEVYKNEVHGDERIKDVRWASARDLPVTTLTKIAANASHSHKLEYAVKHWVAAKRERRNYGIRIKKGITAQTTDCLLTADVASLTNLKRKRTKVGKSTTELYLPDVQKQRNAVEVRLLGSGNKEDSARASVTPAKKKRNKTEKRTAAGSGADKRRSGKGRGGKAARERGQKLLTGRKGANSGAEVDDNNKDALHWQSTARSGNKSAMVGMLEKTRPQKKVVSKAGS